MLSNGFFDRKSDRRSRCQSKKEFYRQQNAREWGCLFPHRKKSKKLEEQKNKIPNFAKKKTLCCSYSSQILSKISNLPLPLNLLLPNLRKFPSLTRHSSQILPKKSFCCSYSSQILSKISNLPLPLNLLLPTLRKFLFLLVPNHGLNQAKTLYLMAQPSQDPLSYGSTKPRPSVLRLNQAKTLCPTAQPWAQPSQSPHQAKSLCPMAQPWAQPSQSLHQA